MALTFLQTRTIAEPPARSLWRSMAVVALFLLAVHTGKAQLFPNSDFEAGSGAPCDCATGYTCQNDAGRVVDGIHPVWNIASQGCVGGTTNYTSPLGAHSGSGYMFFYAGLDQLNTPAYFFNGGEEVELCVWYSGPPAPATAGQNTAAAHFKFGVDGVQVGLNVPVPAGTGWTQHCFTVTMTPGNHVFNILSGNAAQYTIWFDDFTVTDMQMPPCPWEIVGNNVICEGDIAILEVVSATAFDFFWSNGEIGPLTFIYEPGIYWVEIYDDCGVTVDTVEVFQIPPGDVFLGNDTTLCDGATLLLDASTPGSTYIWFDGSTEPTYLVTGPGDYWVEVENACGLTFGTIVVSYTTPPVLDIGADQDLCVGGSLVLDATTPGVTSYLWSDGSTGATATVTYGGLWSVETTGFCGTATDAVTITEIPLPTVDLGPDTSLCQGSSVQLNATYPDATYLWNTGSTSAILTATQPGTYSVTVTTNCGSTNDAVVIGVQDLPQVALGNDTILCPGDVLVLDASWPGATYVWSVGSNQPTLTVNQTGTYIVQVTVPCGMAMDQIDVFYAASPVFSLGNDSTLCDGTSLPLDITIPTATYVWQDGSTSPTYSISTPGTYWATATTVCGTYTDSVDVDFIPIPTLDLGPDTTLCPGEQLVIDATTTSATYLWSTGSTAPTITVGQAGLYAVTVTVSCAVLEDTLDVYVLPIPEIDLPRDTILCDQPYLWLDVTAEEAEYLWQDGNTSPTYLIEAAGPYQVQVTNRCGSDEHAMVVNAIDCSCVPYVPNAFTPNRDGINDRFQPIFACELDKYELLIFNRWGELIFQSKEMDKSWDGVYSGTLSQDGVYVWKLEYRTLDKVEGKMRGHVTLLQ